ncbi:solute carrier family 2 [Salpingoeca rosetta]|uniref:Solute carrier family 2 n=1 Tax=Salpingoeca rosetta (strain ATCC 50818 / BSB-021) TaxID=946362 RepID=F2ULM4_SALR5|nr:solute carrier family 2 [Salpingoeca rosetta]EGD78023.1 solute carrier family 2 [Salpingoeca rosetta]|eukprot:XP_004990085.1 solute carrier family 2 [Salpingoeca rosetta]
MGGGLAFGASSSRGGGGSGDGSDDGAGLSLLRRGPRPTFTVDLLLLTICAGFGGTLFGYDTSVISGALLLLEKEFSLSDFQKEVVVALTVAGAFVGSIVSGGLSSKIGRKPSIIIGSLVFLAGAAILTFSPNWQILAVGRFVVGLGVGAASATVPVYIGECAPSHIRGALTAVNTVCIATGQCLANIVDAAFSTVPSGWRYMFAISAIPAVVQFVAFFFLPESPRFLVAKGERPRAGLVLRKLRGKGFNVEPELDSIEAANTQRQGGLMDILAQPHLRRILFLACMLQVINQVTAINTVMYYSGTILKMAGITSDTQAMWISALVTGVFSVFTVFGLLLVERAGRRSLLLWSLVGVFVSLLVMAQAFYLSQTHSPAGNNTLSDPTCAHPNCVTCLQHHHCGFCVDAGSHQRSGVCLANANTSAVPAACVDAAHWYASAGDVAISNVCPSPYSILTIVSMCLYLSAFGLGVAALPWTINAEIFPTHVRAAGTGYAAAINWVCNLGVSLSFLSLTNAITRAGTFWLYSAIALLSIVYVYFALPETKGRSLEQIEALFMRPDEQRASVHGDAGHDGEDDAHSQQAQKRPLKPAEANATTYNSINAPKW